MNKRSFVVVIMLLVSMVALFAQGSKETSSTVVESTSLEPEDGAVIEFAYWESTSSIGATFTELIEEFEAMYPGVDIVATVYPSSGFATQIDTRLAGKDYPDLFLTQYTNVGKYRNTGLLLDISKYFSKDDISGYAKGFIAPFQSNSALYGAPLHTDTIVLLYNKRIFKEAGIRIPTGKNDAYTIEELEGIGNTLKEKYGFEYAFAGIWTGNRAMRLMPFAYECGVDLFPNDDFTELNIDTKEFRDFLNLYKHWIDSKLLVPETPSQKGNGNNMFMAEVIPFTFSGSWQAENIEKGMPGNWGMTFLPTINGNLSSDLGGNGLVGVKATKYPNAVATFIKYMTSKDIMTRFCEGGGFIPVRTDITREDIQYTKFDSEMKTVIEFASTLSPRLAVAATSPNWSIFNQILSEELDAIIVDGASADDVIKAMLMRWEEEL